MLCNLCKGIGNLLCLFPLEWWECPKCKGHGALQQFGPCEIKLPRQKGMKKKLNR